MGLFRQEYQRKLPFPPPSDVPNPGIESASCASPTLAGRFFTTATPGMPELLCTHSQTLIVIKISHFWIFFFPWKHLPSALLPPSVITLLLGFLLWSSPFLQFLVLSDLLTSCRLVPVWARHRKFVTNILHDWVQWWFLRLCSLAPAAFHSGVTLVISARTLEVSALHCSLFLGHSGLHWLSKLITTSKSFILDFSGGPVVKTSSFQCRGCPVDPSLVVELDPTCCMLRPHTQRRSFILTSILGKGKDHSLKTESVSFRKVKSLTVPGTRYLHWIEAP